MALTSWGPHRKGQVRTRKGCVQGCHSQARDHMRRNKSGHGTNVTGKGHLPTGDRIVRDKSGHERSAFEKVSLTAWRPHREKDVRKWIECNRESGTHSLKTASGGTNQDTERIGPRQGHSRTGDRIVRDKSGYRKNATERVALTHWRPHREKQIRTRDECDRAIEKGTLTHWRPHRIGQVRIRKEYDRASGTHKLETA